MARRRKGPLPSVSLVDLSQKHGGFTTDETTGQIDPPGTFASVAGHERVVEGTLRATDVTRYRRDKAAVLSGEGMFLGGYREPFGTRQRSPQREGDTTYLDVSRQFIGPNRVEEAVAWARPEGQVSVYDADTNSLHYVHTSDHVPEDQQYAYSASMADAVRAQKAGRVEEMVDAVVQAQGIAHPERSVADETPDVPTETMSQIARRRGWQA